VRGTLLKGDRALQLLLGLWSMTVFSAEASRVVRKRYRQTLYGVQ
jgi:hypothetical protein